MIIEMIETAEAEAQTSANPAPEQDGIVRPRIVMLPDGRMDSANAAAYLGRDVLTLKNWRYRSKKRGTQIGPPFMTLHRAVFYFKDDLDKYIAEHRR
jgi:hypothetical protein